MAWQSPADFYNAVYDKAVSLGASDTQARLAAAQASQETGFGQHYVGNNLFGVKASDDYTGPSVNAATNEEVGGQNVTINDKFRAFDDPLDSVSNYLGVVQSNFPDAFAGETFSDAATGLNSGIYGKYATDSGYGRKISAIDARYGPYAYANIENAPMPYSPQFAPIDLGLPDDVVPVDDPNFSPASANFAYAEDPANVPVPSARPNIPTGDLLTAFQANPDYKTPFDTLLSPAAPAMQPGEWGVINGVGPVYTPTFNQWAPVAAAEPVSSPMGSVTASGDLSTIPGLDATATARPMLSLPATADASMTPGLEANATVRGMPDIATPASRMGIAEPGFDPSRFDGGGVSVADGFDASRFTSPSEMAFDPSRFGQQQIDPATNTTSFLNGPAPADLGNMPDAYASQRGPLTGVNSAEMQAMQGNAAYQAQKLAGAQQLAAPPSSLMANLPAYQTFDPAPGVFGQYDTSRMMQAVDQQAQQDTANAVSAPMFNQTSINHMPGLANEKNPYGIDPMVALNAQPADFASNIVSGTATPTLSSLATPSSVTSYAEDPVPAPAIQAIDDNFEINSPAGITQTLTKSPGLISPAGSVLAASPEFTNYTVANSIIGQQPIQQNGFLTSFPTAAVNGTIEPSAVNDVVADPNMESFQPSEMTTVTGPATTPAIDQQQTTQVTNTAPATTTATRTTPARATQTKGLLSGLFSPETATGGLLGSLALGPAGGLLGALAGQQIARSGGLASLMSPTAFGNTDQIGGGIANIGGIYNGAFSPGTFAVASNGAQVGAQPGGWTSYTSPSGVTNMISPTGQQSSYFGGAFDNPDEDSEAA